jgi:hypothetical protein
MSFNDFLAERIWGGRDSSLDCSDLAESRAERFQPYNPPAPISKEPLACGGNSSVVSPGIEILIETSRASRQDQHFGGDYAPSTRSERGLEKEKGGPAGDYPRHGLPDLDVKNETHKEQAQ